MQVEIWSDVVCPWCYLGKRRFERALEAFDHRDAVEVTYRSFELDPSAERMGTTPTIERLATKYGMTVAAATEAQREMEQRAAEDGLEFHMEGLRSGTPAMPTGCCTWLRPVAARRSWWSDRTGPTSPSRPRSSTMLRSPIWPSTWAWTERR